MSNKVITQAKENFISERTSEEMRLAEWDKNIRSVDQKAVFGDYKLPEDLTLRTHCPEAYKDVPDERKYKEQYESFRNLCEEINLRIDAYLQQVAQCTQS